KRPWAASRSATMHQAKGSEFLQLPLWPAMTRRSGSHDHRDGDGTACGRSPRTRADVVERGLAQLTHLQLATLERFANARFVAQDAQEQVARRRHRAFSGSILLPPPPPPIARPANTAASPPVVAVSILGPRRRCRT